jgi:hypothetical protein
MDYGQISSIDQSSFHGSFHFQESHEFFMSQRHGNPPRKPATKQPHLQKKMRKQKSARFEQQPDKTKRGKGR